MKPKLIIIRPLLHRLARGSTLAALVLLATWLFSPSASAAMFGSKGVGTSCGHNTECKSGFCDAGNGTSKTNKCIPGPAKGGTDDYCSNHNQCSTGKCAGLRPSNSGGWIGGKCTGKRDLAKSCASHGECKSGFCDAGNGTSKTNKCIPGPAKGTAGDYCSNDNQCSTANCKGLRPNGSGGWIAGTCAGKQGLGQTCSNNGQCATGRCDAGNGTSHTAKCVPQAAKGKTGDYCSNDNQCSSTFCDGLRPKGGGHWVAGTCGGKQTLGKSCSAHAHCASGA